MARILIVDDSPTEAHVLTDVLTRNGHEVMSASNGTDGLTMARRRQPDIVLMDVVMPGVNGFEATRELTHDQDTRHIPVIIVTSKRQPVDEVWGRRQGASGYITKPVAERRLIDEVNRVLMQHLTSPT